MIEVTLTQGFVAVIDDEDAELTKYRWRAIVDSPVLIYGRRHLQPGSSRTYAALHREVAERAYGLIPAGYVVDHINGDTLDNRRSNLRVVTDQHNRWNRHHAYKNSKSGVVGVIQRPDTKKWRAYIDDGTKRRSLGNFDTMEEAIAARRSAEAERQIEAVSALH